MRRKAVQEYRRGKLSIGRAAEEAGIPITEFYKTLEEEGIPVKVDTAAIKEAVKNDFGE